MAQTWTADCFSAAHAYNTDLTNMEANFATLLTLFSGAGAPATMAACHPWFDTTKHVLKVRDDGSTAWLGLMHGDTSQKIWVYRDGATLAGWALYDTGITDKLMAIKGGTTYTAGAATAGTWTISGFADHLHSQTAHVHVWYNNNAAAGTNDQSYDSAGALENLAAAQNKNAGVFGIQALGDYATASLSDDYYTSNPTAAVNTGSASLTHDGTWRPQAAVGTVQYLNL